MPRRAPAAFEPMKAMPSELPADPGAFSFEIKWDGMRAVVDARGSRLRIVSRNGLDQADRFPELAGIAGALAGRRAVLDGEIVAFDEDGRPDFGRLQERFGLLDPATIRERARRHPAHFIAFDVLALDGEDLTGRPFRERRRILEGLRFAGDSWATSPSHVGAGREMLAMSRRLGLEGVMAKRLDSPYLPGERSPAWLKVRTRNRQEFVVGGWSEGEGSREGTFGALLVGYYPRRLGREGMGGAAGRPAARPRSAAGSTARRGVNRQAGKAPPLRFAGRVGSGYRDEDTRRLQRELDRLALTTSPFESLPDRELGDVHFVEPRLVVEVEFNGLSRHNVLRQPSFKGLRADKDALDVVWEQAEVRPWRERSGAGRSVSAS